MSYHFPVCKCAGGDIGCGSVIKHQTGFVSCGVNGISLARCKSESPAPIRSSDGPVHDNRLSSKMSD